MRKGLVRLIPRTTRLVVPGALLILLAPLADARATVVAMSMQQQATATVVGQVTDTRTSQGIAGVVVNIDGGRLGAVTGEDGRYRIVNAPTGSHVLATQTWTSPRWR
jgi:hypothetical protein